MQPSEPGPQQPAPDPGLPARPRGLTGKGPNRRLRLFLALGIGILALLCLGGVGVGISLYDEATAINRTAPDAVVDNFLGAYLVNGDDEDAALYRCDAERDFASLSAYREEITKIEKDATVSIDVSWTSLTVDVDESEGTVSTELVRTSSDRSRDGQNWSFRVVNQDGWRVCGATRTA